MKYQMMADESFVDKLNKIITYKPGDTLKTEVNENRKNDLVARKLAHVVKEIDTAEEEAAKKLAEEEEEAAKKLAEEEEAAKKLAEEEEAAKKKASENPTNKK